MTVFTWAPSIKDVRNVEVQKLVENCQFQRMFNVPTWGGGHKPGKRCKRLLWSAPYGPTLCFMYFNSTFDSGGQARPTP